jgi:sulfur-oxidizing protein SoxZ
MARPCSRRRGAGRREEPFPVVQVQGGVKGEKVQITWTDNRGDKRTDEAVIA